MTKVSDVGATYIVERLARAKKATHIRLGELIRPRREKLSPASAPDVPYIGMEHVEAHSTKLLDMGKSGAMKSAANRFYDGDVLYGRLRPYLNKVHRAHFNGLCSAEFIVLPKTDGIDPDFLKWRMNADDFVRFASRLNAGDRPRVDFDQISDFEVLLPSLDEQRRIVAEIEERLSRLEAGVAALKRVQANLKRYRASVISEPFAEIENKVHTIWQTGREVFGFVTSGSRGWAKYYSDSGALFLRVGNIRREDIKLELGDIQRVAPPLGAEGLRTRVEPGDILITITADVGRVGLAGSTIGEAFVNQHVALARPRSRFNPRYLAWYLASSVGNQQLRLNERGATRTGLGLNDILAARIPYINNIEQDRIVAEIERRLSVVEELETQVCTDLARAERLRQAILHQAFMQPDSESTVTR